LPGEAIVRPLVRHRAEAVRGASNQCAPLPSQPLIRRSPPSIGADWQGILQATIAALFSRRTERSVAMLLTLTQ
jgi:hypothetical protein